ncbi:acyloxyacyl hydrolase [Flavobacterium terrigena]|uniref:Lipid A 3-O-deacylase (PagL) n=1 Tax=Flavobacterium terrigena TaxID=402734 RepID=A0A1H6RTP3_9FLAO|nr:acyloxyacyl hydrolase [Flavobacterium terrigena]SEI57806.1 Lipid A 3-O-deacylase (PagL) [Flavobacterium terrigena]
MKLKYLIIISLLFSVFAYSQDTISKFKWLRTGVVIGYASQNTFIKQESDYTYENQIVKFTNHFNWSKKRKHSWEILVEPSYYQSKHQMINYWFISHTEENGDELRAKYMRLKTINEYALHLGLVYRRYFNLNSSIFATLNTGPMYIDTDTERLKKGFAFSDVLSVGYNYRIKKLSFDAKFMFRHASNANLQKPNYGLNSSGFEIGAYYELN